MPKNGNRALLQPMQDFEADGKFTRVSRNRTRARAGIPELPLMRDETGLALIRDAAAGRWLLFRNPEAVIAAYGLADVLPALEEVERQVTRKRLYAAGFLSYEAAPAFDPAMRTPDPLTERSGFPLLWFGLYSTAIRAGEMREAPSVAAPLEWKPSVNDAEYSGALRRIRDLIARGDTYQVNYTLRLRSSFHGRPQDLFLDLLRAQEADYGGYVDLGRFAICSASPELLFRLEGSHLLSEPMKGTAERGLTLRDDAEQARRLRLSEKDRAENLMIVDMVRNDLGRIARTGSVRASRLFELRRYQTIWQMISTVEADTDRSVLDVFSALFPAASITGAPKISTMSIIADLERSPRRIYTGCLGYFGPDRQAQFNVAIRTVLVDRESGLAEYGVGGGIVWDSSVRGEAREWKAKARILTVKRPEFALLETMLWDPTAGYLLLKQHLRRLRGSAKYFGFPVDAGEIEALLDQQARGFGSIPQRVRLTVASDGRPSITGEPLARDSHLLGSRALDSPPISPVRLRMARTPVDSRDPFLRHKTTHRLVYESARREVEDCDDVVLWNERGEVTETTVANLVIGLDERRVTPAEGSGLLAGTYREWMLERGELEEDVVMKESLLDRRRSPASIHVINSVRGVRPAVLLQCV